MAAVSSLVWRPMLPTDVKKVHRLADKVHTELPESELVFRERLDLFPKGCFVLSYQTTSDASIHGYIVAHPIRHNCPPALDSLIGEISDDAAQFYIHDVVVSPDLRGKGYASKGIEKVLAVAERIGYPTTCLIAVYNMTEFWKGFGFLPEPVEGELREKLRLYGDEAEFCVRANGVVI